LPLQSERQLHPFSSSPRQGRGLDSPYSDAWMAWLLPRNASHPALLTPAS
jgi:hypothetical protein